MSDSQIQQGIEDWVASYEGDGYKVTDKVRELMRMSLDCQLHPDKYPTDFSMTSVMKIEAQVKEDNGEHSPLSGLDSIDDFVNQAVSEIKDSMKDKK